MSTEQIPITDTPFEIAGRTLRSRLILGTGGFPRLETLADAIRATRAELVPGVLELEVEEAIAGLRPGTPDNAPIIGRSPSDPRIVWATGHYRNGVLLAPVTAGLVVAELTGEPVEHAFGPGRFVGAVA